MSEAIKTSVIVQTLSGGSVIPVFRTMEDFKFALNYAAAPSVMLMFGDINGLPQVLSLAKQYKKRIILHVDLLEGISKDRTGVKFLARAGITAVVTTRSQLVRLAREEGMIAVQRLFLVDSASVKVGIQLLHKCKPDILEVMPAYTPAKVMALLARETSLPILAGGFLCTEEDITSGYKMVHAR